MTWDSARTLKRVAALEKERAENPKSVLDLNPQGLVTWTEVYAMMREDGYSGNPVDARFEWDKAFNGPR